MLRLSALLPPVLLVALLVSGAAVSTCPASDPDAVVDLPVGLSEEEPGRLYVIEDVCYSTCLVSIWIYEETNDEPGLQRQDPYANGTCGGSVLPDTIRGSVYVEDELWD